MAKPQEVTIPKRAQKSVLSMFKKTTKDARRISDELQLPRHQVMYFLETEGLKEYSEGSYC